MLSPLANPRLAVSTSYRAAAHSNFSGQPRRPRQLSETEIATPEMRRYREAGAHGSRRSAMNSCACIRCVVATTEWNGVEATGKLAESPNAKVWW